MNNTYANNDAKAVGIWHNIDSSRPDHSCEVLVITKGKYVSCINYSKKWDSFNCFDGMDRPNHSFSDIVAWCYKEDFIADAESELGLNFNKIFDEYKSELWDRL